jgi:hypothetical protein
MSVSSISGSSQNPYLQIKSDFQTLSQALKSGDLDAAQQAYSAIQQDQQSSQHPINSQLSADFTALGNALQSGDLAGAQQAFSSLQSNAQALRQSRGGKGHHDHASSGGDQDDSSSSTSDAQKTVADEVSTTNADGTITVTTTYTDGTTSATTEPNPNPVVSQSPLSTSNAGQLSVLLNAQEQATKAA